MTKCCKCKREKETQKLGQSKHIICFACFDDWHTFAQAHIEKLVEAKKQNNLHEVWEVTFRQFIDNKEVVQFT